MIKSAHDFAARCQCKPKGVFDDSNPSTRDQWHYPDTKTWDPQRNTEEFVGNMSAWKETGLLAFTVGMQGGSVSGLPRHQRINR